MATITFRVTDQKADKLKKLAEKMDVSVNKLLDEITTSAIAYNDARLDFEMRAARGDRHRGLEILDMIEHHVGDKYSHHSLSSAVHEPPAEPFDHQLDNHK